MQLRRSHQAAQLTQTITLPRPGGDDLTLVLRPLPLGFHRRLRERGLNPPAPPQRIARDSAGRPLRDEAGLAVTTPHTTDPEYLADLETYHQRVAILAVAESLQADPDIRFETPLPTSPAPGVWAAYADNLYAEFEAAGFAAGDLILLCQAVGRLSNLFGDHLHQARANFSSPGPITPT